VELSSVYAIGLVALFATVLVGCEKDRELSPSPEPATPAEPKLYEFWRKIVPRCDPRPMLGG
jgi:hypothetical protein